MTFDASDVVRLVTAIIIGGLIILLWIVKALNNTDKGRFRWSFFVLVLYSAGVWGLYYKVIKYPQKIAAQERIKAGSPSKQEYKERYKKAKALFDQRCKTAGEKIYRTIDDVEGILLLNVRPGDVTKNRANPNWPDAGLPDELGGISYIKNFLAWEHLPPKNQRGYLNSDPKNSNGFPVFPGYDFVDVKESDNTINRYRYQQELGIKLIHTKIKKGHARYAVAYHNMIDVVDRALWVAGTTVTITDTQTNQLVAEKTWYSFEPGQGSTAGSRSPWGFAITCPPLNGWRGGATRMFVDQVLKPNRG